MAEVGNTHSMGFWERMNSIPKIWLYLILMILTSVALLPKVALPNKPDPENIDLFATLMQIPEGKTIILSSDWTTSTRGESQAQMDALLRLVMRRNLKFAVISVGDARAPQVARDRIRRINEERKAAGERVYEKWNDYVELGFFVNVEGTFNAMANNLRTAWKGRRENQPGKGLTDIFESPVLKDINSIGDIQVIVDIHASNVVVTMLERLYGKVPLVSMCTGVMGPETKNYYMAGQLKGLCIGLNGAVGFENMMEKGIEPEGKDGMVRAPGHPRIEGFKGQKNLGLGATYYLSLHAAMALLILAVVIGNIGMFVTRRRAQGS